MARIPKGKERELAPAGQHLARAVGFIDLGTQKVVFEGKKKLQHKAQIAWELVDEQTSNGDPMVVYQQITFSGDSRSGLVKLLDSWLGIEESDIDDFDMDDILDEPALLTIKIVKSAKGRKYDKITAVTSVPKKMGKVAKASEELVSLYLDDSFDEKVFDKLNNYVKGLIMESEEYKEMFGEAEDEKKSKSKKRSRDDEEEEEEEEDEDEKPRRKKKVRDEEEEEEEEEESEEEEEEEEETPRRKNKRKPSKKDDDDEDEVTEEEEEEEEEDEKPKRKPAKKVVKKAPAKRKR